MTESEASVASSLDANYDSDAEISTIKSSLQDCLDNVKTAGSFATSGLLPDTTLSGLFVHNVGSIGFPLQEEQAKAIVGACHRAPFGQGDRTVVDESVRKTWQLNPDQFELRNPRWPSVVRKVTEQVAQELGCTEAASVSAQLYKLLLYEEGAMSKPHKDTEKAPGMFGTLVICLPSEYQGGVVVASHRGESKTFDPAFSAFDHAYIAWYADVTHEVMAVTSGRRLVLTYNLIDLSQGLQRSAAMLTREKRMLKGIISSWTRGIEKGAYGTPDFLAYKLDHEYTNASLKFQSLKGLDKIKAECLREVCAKANACFFLASMECKVEGSCEEDYGHRYYPTQKMHTLEEIVGQSTELKRIIELDGSLLAREIPINEADIVQEHPFERDPDKENFGGYTGNEGASATHFYHDTVAVLVPFKSLAWFLSNHVQQGIVDINSWYKRLSKKVQENPNDEASSKELYHLALLINQTPSRPEPPQSIQAQRRNYYGPRKDYFPAPEGHWPIEASILLKDQVLFEVAIESTKSSCLSALFFQYIGKAMCLFDLPTTHAQINHVISRLPSFHSQYKAFVSLVASYEAETRDGVPGDRAMLHQIEAWAEETYMHKLQSVDKVERKDGLHLADLAIEHADRKPLLEYLHLAKPLSKFSAFSVAFAVRLLQGTGPERACLFDDAFDVFLELFIAFLPTFSVECQSMVKRERSVSNKPSGTVQCLLNPTDVAILLVQLDMRDLEDEVLKMTSKLEAEAGRVDVVAYESLFLPLLEALTGMVVWTSARVIRFGKFFRTTLSIYAGRFVQIEPQAGNWTMTPRGCGCSDCQRLDQFLTNDTQQSVDFPVSRGRRQHLHQMLEFTKIGHVTDRHGVETLVVTKPSTPLLAKHEQWQKRFSKAEKQIKKMDQAILKQLLGDDYEYLTELRDTRRGQKRLPGARVALARQGPEIIDLT